MTNDRGDELTQQDVDEIADDKGVAVVGGTSRSAARHQSARERARERGRPDSRRSRTEPQRSTEANEWDEDDTDETGRTRRQVQAAKVRRSARRSTIVMSRASAYVLGLLGVAGVVAGVAFGFAWSNLNSQNKERQAVKSVATTCLLDLTNFKPSTVDADFAALQNCAAPGSLFASQAAQTFSTTTRQDLIRANAVYQGEMRNIFVETVSSSKAEVYAVLDTKYQNAKVNTPVTDTLRVTVDLSNTAQGWRLSTITVENPSGTAGGPAGTTPSSTPAG